MTPHGIRTEVDVEAIIGPVSITYNSDTRQYVFNAGHLVAIEASMSARPTINWIDRMLNELSIKWIIRQSLLILIPYILFNYNNKH